MSRKKKKSSAAENLIESLMDDLKDIKAESSIHSGEIGADPFSALPNLNEENHRVENTNLVDNSWENIESEIQSSEFGGEDRSAEFEMPEGFGELPPSERYMVGPSAIAEERYQGPSSDGGYQSADEILAAVDESTKPVGSATGPVEDKTVSIQQDVSALSAVTSGTDAEKTVAVEGFANARKKKRGHSEPDVKVSVGSYRGGRGAANVLTSVDASLAQAENLKFAQQRILDLEKEVEGLRAENEELASAGEIIRSRTDQLAVRISSLEKEKSENQESAESEILILKGNLQYKESEVAKARLKVEELETRLKSDFKKIRVRERELENRLELLRAEKSALVRSKDEYILEQKRKIDQLSQELDNYRKKCLELNRTIEANQDQVKRTERALRLALNNLEAKEESLTPLKKAE